MVIFRELFAFLGAFFLFFIISSPASIIESGSSTPTADLPDLRVTKIEAVDGYCKGWNTIKVHVKAANASMNFTKIPLTLYVDYEYDCHTYTMQINGPGMSLIPGGVFVFENVIIGRFGRVSLRAVVNETKILREVNFKNNELYVKAISSRSCASRPNK